MNRVEMKKIFVDHFKEDTLSLAYDSVPNVRIALARVLKFHFRQISGNFIDDKQMNQAVVTLAADAEEDVRIIIAQIKEFHTQIEDSSSEASQRSNTHMNPLEDEKVEAEQDFIENLKKPYAGEHNELLLSQGSSVSNDIEKVTPGSAAI